MPHPPPSPTPPPLQPRRALLAITCAILALWIAFLLVLYFTVVR
jgi:hypothetical protein